MPSKKFNIVLLGSSEFTLICYKALKATKQNVLAIVSVSPDKLPLNSVDIKAFCTKEKIGYFESDDLNKTESLQYLKAQDADFLFSTWPFILKQDVINSAKHGVIGTHPTKIPLNRGRHPIHWLIDLNARSTHLSFFRMDLGVDTGEVLHQEKFPIYPDKEIPYSLNEMNKAATRGIKKIFTRLSPDTAIKSFKQNEKKANYLRKRTIHDSLLDMRLRGEDLMLLCNSFAPPYPGASLIWGSHILKVKKASFKKVATAELQKMEHGKVIRSSINVLVVKCRNGVIKFEFCGVIPQSLLKKQYLMPPSYYLMRNFQALSSKINN